MNFNHCKFGLAIFKQLRFFLIKQHTQISALIKQNLATIKIVAQSIFASAVRQYESFITRVIVLYVHFPLSLSYPYQQGSKVLANAYFVSDCLYSDYNFFNKITPQLGIGKGKESKIPYGPGGSISTTNIEESSSKQYRIIIYLWEGNESKSSRDTRTQLTSIIESPLLIKPDRVMNVKL